LSSVTADHPAEIHHSHRDVTGGWLRPAVFGVMDGLVSNFALIAGVAGAGTSGHSIVLTGLAGMAAGACSMASGEYISVSSQAEATHAEIKLERNELRNNPDGELRELTRLYRARGLSPQLARQVAQALSENEDVAWRVHVREELGVNPDDLPSPWVAAASSFAAFALGAFVPLLPYVLGATSLLPASLLCVLALILSGGLTAKLTTRPVWLGGGRQLLFGVIAAAVTFGIGHLVGAGLS
jgi:VIT1/CCC1 family predicted Fe2+/Mn2+ transporter